MKCGIVYFADGLGWLLSDDLTPEKIQQLKDNPTGELQVGEWEVPYVDFFVLPPSVRVGYVVSVNAQA